MCGRYTLSRSTKEILEFFEIDEQPLEFDFEASYNVAPAHMVPVVIAEETEQGSSKRRLHLVQWGLIPFWVKDLKKSKPLINARSETILEKPSFKNSLNKRRCVIPVDSFYEWRKIGSARIPTRIKLPDDQIFALAGLYDDWKSPDGTIKRTFTIITVAANQAMAGIHDRMPAILSKDAQRQWLDPSLKDGQPLAQLLVPYQQELSMHRVSTMVNSPSVNTIECIAALPDL